MEGEEPCAGTSKKRGREERTGLHQTSLGSVGRGFGAIGGAGLVEYVGYVIAHRAEANKRFFGDFTVCISGRN